MNEFEDKLFLLATNNSIDGQFLDLGNTRQQKRTPRSP